MKRNNIKNRFRWMPASLLLLLATACSDNILDTAGVAEPKTSVVTFTVNMESQTVSTRAAGEGEDEAATSIYHISDGTHVDVLKYAVYLVETDEKGDTLLTLDERFEKEKQINKVKTSTGQRLLAATPDKFPMKISLSLDMDKTYKVAFWAQNSETEAYNTDDLRKVKVNYANAANNDELRDAFCALSDTIDKLSVNNKVTLRRPLAQVNVGTTGWDYEGAAILPPSAVIYNSQITLEGVAQYYDVLEGKALTSEADFASRDIKDEDLLTTATFDYARIPAFINVSDDEWDEAKDDKYKPFTNEEYLKVEINKEEGYKPYYGWYDYQDYIEKKKKDGSDTKIELPETETFKYLSMCYVLVPEAKKITSEDGVSNATYGSVLHNVTFKAQSIDEDGTKISDIEPTPVFTISNVPVQKNWRTNILGNNFFVVNENLNLTIVTDYCGDYNYTADGKGETGNTSDKREDEAHDIWFDNYGCGESNQNAQESSDYFKMLSHKYTLPDGPSWHKHDLKDSKNSAGSTTYTSIYNGKAVGRVLKMQGKTGIAFDVKDASTVTIVQAIGRSYPTTNMPAADGTLLFYKKLEGETLKTSTTNTGITDLTVSDELKTANETYINSYFKDGNEPVSKYFKRLDVDGATETDDYSATTDVYTTDFYDDQENSNTDTNKDVRIYKIYIKNPGTYILRNGGKYKPGVLLKNIYKKSDGNPVDKADESGIAFIKIQKGDHRQEAAEEEEEGIDWNLWEKKENPDYKEPEDNTGGGSDSTGE